MQGGDGDRHGMRHGKDADNFEHLPESGEGQHQGGGEEQVIPSSQHVVDPVS